MATRKKKPEEKPKIGRPTKYSLALAQKICKVIATSTDSLKNICAHNDEFPTDETIRQWRYDFREFSSLYAEAKRFQADLLAEQIVEIAANGCDDFYIDENGNRKPNSVNVMRARLIVDTQKWIASKMIPKVYGDKIQEEEKQDFKEALNAIKEIAKKCMKPI